MDPKKYYWNMMAIAINSECQFIYHSDLGSIKVQYGDYFLIHENGLVEVLPCSEFRQNYKFHKASSNKLHIYTKRDLVYSTKVDKPFVADNNNIIFHGQPHDFLVQSTESSRQYALTPQEHSVHLCPCVEMELRVDSLDDSETSDEQDQGDQDDNTVDDNTIENNLENEYPQFLSFDKFMGLSFLTQSINEKDFLKKKSLTKSREELAPTLTDDLSSLSETHSKESNKIQNLSDFDQLVEETTLTWNTQDCVYLAYQITNNFISIEFQNGIDLFQSTRFKGVKGDYLIFTHNGYFFAILTPDEFHHLCESEPLAPQSKLYLINKFYCDVIKSQEITSAVGANFWKGSKEVGQRNFLKLQINIPVHDDNSQIVYRSIEFNKNKLLTREYCQFQNIYGWIESDFNVKDFFSVTNNNFESPRIHQKSIKSISRQNPRKNSNNLATIIDEMVETSPIPHPVIHFYRPFDLTKEYVCWEGMLERKLLRKDRWKRVHVAIYPHKICIIPQPSKNKSPGSMKYFLFSQIKSIQVMNTLEGQYVQIEGARKRDVNLFTNFINKITKNIDIERFRVVSTQASTLKSDQNYFNHQDAKVCQMKLITNDSLCELFSLCQAWAKREKLYRLTRGCFEFEKKQNKVDGETIKQIQDILSNDLSSKTITNILTPSKKSESSYLIFLTSYSYQSSVRIIKHILDTFYEQNPFIIQPTKFDCYKYNILHNALICENLLVIQFFKNLKNDVPYYKDFFNSEYDTIFDHNSYIYTIKNPKILIEFYPTNLPTQLLSTIDDEGNNFLMNFMLKGYHEVVYFIFTTYNLIGLIESKSIQIDLNLQNSKQQSLLSLSLSLLDYRLKNIFEQEKFNNISNLIKLLLDNGCDPNFSDLGLNNSIHIICTLITSFINNVNNLKEEEYTNILSNYTNILQLLIKKNCNLLTLNQNGDTGLSIICDINNISNLNDISRLELIVNLLLQYDTLSLTKEQQQDQQQDQQEYNLKILNHDFPESQSASPLHRCCINANYKLAQLLLDKGAYPNLKDQYNKTPLDILNDKERHIKSSSNSSYYNNLANCMSLFYRYQNFQSTRPTLSSKDAIFVYDENCSHLQSAKLSSLVSIICDREKYNEADTRGIIKGYYPEISHIDFANQLKREFEKINQINTMNEEELFVKKRRYQVFLTCTQTWATLREVELQNILIDQEFVGTIKNLASLISNNCSNLITNEKIRSLSSENIHDLFSGFSTLIPNEFNRTSFLLTSQNVSINYDNNDNENNDNNNNNNNTSFANIDEFSFVRQICLEMQSLFQNIKPEEFELFYSTFKDYDANDITDEDNGDDDDDDENWRKCPNIMKFYQYKSKLKRYFINEFLRYFSITYHADILNKLLDCAFLCLNVYRNYELTQVIYSVLNESLIIKFKASFDYYEEIYPAKLVLFYDTVGIKCRNLKKLIDNLSSSPSSYPMIPLISFYSSELRKALSMKKVIQVSKSPNSLHLNVFALKSIDKIQIDINKAQTVSYKFSFNQMIHQSLLKDTSHNLEEIFVKLRSKEDETNQETKLDNTKVNLKLDNISNEELKNYQEQSFRNELSQQNSTLVVDDEINKIVNAVDGSFRNSEKVIKSFIHKVTEFSIKLKPHDANKILACYLITKYVYQAEKIVLPNHKRYLESFGAKVPSTATNQLRGNKNNHAYKIYKLFESQNLLQDVDFKIMNCFTNVYKITDDGISFYTEDIDSQNQRRSNVPKIIQDLYRNEGYCRIISKVALSQLETAYAQNNIIPVAGTGVSSSLTKNQNLSVVQYHGLLDGVMRLVHGDFAADGDTTFNGWSGLNIPQKVERLVQFSDQYDLDYKRFIFPLLDCLSPDPDPHLSIATAIRAFGTIIVTTNYDYLLETILHRLPHNMEPTDDDFPIHEYIFHLHGVAHDAANIIVETSQITFDTFALKMLSYCRDKSLLFIGSKFGALDEDFKSYYDRYPHLQHYLLLTKAEYRELVNDPIHGLHFIYYMHKQILLPVIYGDDHIDLVPSLYELHRRKGVRIIHEDPPHMFIPGRNQRLLFQEEDGNYIPRYLDHPPPI